MTDTTYLGLGKPTVGADSDDWGGILNADLDQLDALWANLGNNAFGTAAAKAVGFFAQPANNLSDLPSATTARTNLGLGPLATQAGASPSAAVVAALGFTPISGINGSMVTTALGYTPLSTAGTAASAARVDLASGVAIDWDGADIRFIIGGVVKARVTPSGGLTNIV